MNKIVVVTNLGENVYETDMAYSTFANQMQNISNGYEDTVHFRDKSYAEVHVNPKQVSVIKFIKG